MIGRTHDLVAFTALVIVIIALPALPAMSFPTAVVAFGANFIGGLFPDIDQTTSDFWDNFRLGPFVAKVVCPLLGGHRNLSHSLIGFVLIGTGAWVLFRALTPYILIDFSLVWWSFMIGVTSHLVADALTREGIPFFFPFKWKIGFPPIAFLRMKSDGLIEKYLVFPGLLALNAYLLVLHQERVRELLRLFL